ncbi:hypothetical protein, partial [Corynebacterium sp. HMSC055D05]|uniref:hypothetical protein n=1 Tax=Corynebacterium sp. HMSC055D05 TaxID=1715213 RepID=UPI00143BB082
QYRLVHQYAAGIFPTTTTTPGTQGDGQWTGSKVTGVTIQYVQKDRLPQHLPEEQWAESQGKGLYGLYQGHAFWNLDYVQGYKSYRSMMLAKGPKVPAAAGLTVVGS